MVLCYPPEEEMETKPKKKFIKSRLFILLSAYLSLAALITPLALMTHQGERPVIGDYFIVGGIVVSILCFLFMDKGRTRSNARGSSSYVQNDQQFKSLRAQQKPVERVLIMILTASLTIAATGYLLNSFVFS